MTFKQIKYNYKKQYESINFERIELFKCLKSVFNPNSILYLGSSIHITPSFIFSNVTYIDNSKLSKQFFLDTDEVVEFINNKKEYTRSVKINYLDIDYQIMDIKDKYNLVVSIFSPNSLNASLKSLNKNGILIYLPLPSDKETIKDDYSVKYIGHISVKKSKYDFFESGIKKLRKQQSNYLVGGTFIDKEVYDVYKKE